MVILTGNSDTIISNIISDTHVYGIGGPSHLSKSADTQNGTSHNSVGLTQNNPRPNQTVSDTHVLAIEGQPHNYYNQSDIHKGTSYTNPAASTQVRSGPDYNVKKISFADMLRPDRARDTCNIVHDVHLFNSSDTIPDTNREEGQPIDIHLS